MSSCPTTVATQRRICAGSRQSPALALGHRAGREAPGIGSEIAAEGDVTTCAHPGRQLPHLRCRRNLVLRGGVVQWSAADQPYRHVPQCRVIPSDEPASVAVPSVGIQRAGNDHRVDTSQVVHVAGPAHHRVATGVVQRVTDHGRQAGGAAPLGPECHEYPHHRPVDEMITGCAAASASTAMALSVARMMCATKGRISHQ